jgi:hypothetical protein
MPSPTAGHRVALRGPDRAERVIGAHYFDADDVIFDADDVLPRALMPAKNLGW